MKKYTTKLNLLFCSVFFSISAIHAQKWPVGIASMQDSVKSVQLGIISSTAIHQMKGLQLGAFANMSAAPIRGMQLSAISNISIGVKRGLQVASLFNIASGQMQGLQLSLHNFTDELNGVQLGLFNTAISHPKGWQIGLLNITKDEGGHKIGLLNVSPSTTIDYMAFGGNVNKINMAVRFRNQSTYRIVGVGTHYMGLNKKFSGAIVYRLGQYKQLTPHWSLSADLGFAHIETFEEENINIPKRLYSIQGRVNVDYQFNKYWGAFASVGYGDTRYYSHNTRYRNRMIFEAGLTLRHQRRLDTAPVKREKPSVVEGGSLAQWPKHKSAWLAAAEVTGINFFVHAFDRWVMNEEFAQTTWKSIGNNFKNAFVWDNDFFITNLFAHPYHGNLYYNSARSNGLNFWESAPFALGGSLMWELFGETEPPAINDVMATSMGGIAIGEVTHRLSDAVLDDSQRGVRRFMLEAVSTLINPIKGLNRIISGAAWRVNHQNALHHDWERFPINFTAAFGNRYLADDGAFFRGEHNPFITLGLEYGDALNEKDSNKPYDYFDVEANFGLSKNQPFINRLHLLGRLWSTPMYSHDNGMRAEFGLYQHFNYYNSEPVKDGTELTPYRISEAASVGPGIIVRMPQVGVLTKLEQRVFLSGILLGGTKSDYFNVLERDYNMGSGFSIKSKTHIELRNFGRFSVDVNFFKLYTWKGYEDKDLDNIDDPHYLDVQGDKGNARLFVINPMAEIDLGKQWGFIMNASYFSRKTHYKYYNNVKANTFEFKAGLAYHF